MEAKIPKAPETLSEAYDFVNERFVFTPEHYPALHSLNATNAKIFMLNHVLLHMGKHEPVIAKVSTLRSDIFQDIFEEEPSKIEIAAKFREVTVKQIVNFIKLAELLEIEKSDFIAITSSPHHRPNRFYEALKDIMLALNVKCEEADHQGFMGKERRDYLVEIFINAWSTLLTHFEDEDISVPYRLIPDYMKSK